MIQPPLDVETDALVPLDIALTERIRSKLDLVISDSRNVEIKVREGVVTLSGRLRDSAQSRVAAFVTHRVDGVTNVVNKLTVGVVRRVAQKSVPARPARASS
jgi:hypothetical protein